MRKPYIGITDFMTDEQVFGAMNALNADRSSNNQSLGVGVMMSYKTLNGIETKWSNAFPKNEDVASIFIKHPNAYNVLHYADMDGVDLLFNLEKARVFGGSNLHAIQLDMIWPKIEDVRAFKKVNRDIDIILQIGKQAFSQVKNDPNILIAKLDEYGDTLEAVLLDKSMGTGEGMDAEFLLTFIRAITERYGNDLRIVVAGGLGPKRMYLAEPIIREFPLVSTDAQGRLRPSCSALDPIDWMMAYEYIWDARKMFKECIEAYRYQASLGRKQDLSWERFEE